MGVPIPKRPINLIRDPTRKSTETEPLCTSLKNPTKANLVTTSRIALATNAAPTSNQNRAPTNGAPNISKPTTPEQNNACAKATDA